MADKPPVTKEEALGYDHDALLADIERKKNNMITFQDTIEKEKKGIENNLYIISQIDSDHPDVKMLEENIEKKETNIKTFKDAIKNEEEEIKREKEMVRLIEEESVKSSK